MCRIGAVKRNGTAHGPREASTRADDRLCGVCGVCVGPENLGKPGGTHVHRLRQVSPSLQQRAACLWLQQGGDVLCCCVCVFRHVFHYEVEDGLVYLCMVDQQDKVLSSHLHTNIQTGQGIREGSGGLTPLFVCVGWLWWGSQQRLIFTFLEELKKRFKSSCGEARAQTAIAFSLNEQFAPVLKSLMVRPITRGKGRGGGLGVGEGESHACAV